MRKFKPMTVFVRLHQPDQLRVLAAATRDPKNHKLKDESISSLVRDALTQYIQALEELDDAVKYATVQGRKALREETARIEHAINIERTNNAHVINE